jgi:hypothetical protein
MIWGGFEGEPQTGAFKFTDQGAFVHSAKLDGGRNDRSCRNRPEARQNW